MSRECSWRETSICSLAEADVIQVACERNSGHVRVRSAEAKLGGVSSARQLINDARLGAVQSVVSFSGNNTCREDIWFTPSVPNCQRRVSRIYMRP
ncbi:MAG: hypothetical protein QGH37_05280 [Candidatus Poribacteria bacterium]|nr:hypothetical protein [Candidatus Poribacteria bacterium]